MVSQGPQVGSGEQDSLARRLYEEQRDQQIMLTLVLGWALVVGVLVGIGLWQLRELL